MKFNLFKNLVVGMVLTSLFMISCESDESLEKYQNPNQSDTTGNNLKVDLFVSVEIENVPYNFVNGINNYSNWTLSEKGGICFPDSNRFHQSHVTSFIVTSKMQESIYIDILGCVNNDSASNINVIDSVLVVGPYPYYPTSKDFRSAVVKYIDADSVLWSTAFGGNKSSFANFELSAISPNDFDAFSEKIAFGKFEGYLYNTLGDSLKIKNGQFKGRIVQ